MYFLQKKKHPLIVLLAREPTWLLANKVPWIPIHTYGVLHKHVCIKLACLLSPEVYDYVVRHGGA